MHKHRLTILVAVCGLAMIRPASAPEGPFLDNGQIRIGVDTNAGACVSFFGGSVVGRNLLNHHDFGRYIQQSYYGAPDGSKWDKQDWCWNPVQGGDWRGHPTKLLALHHTNATLYAKTLPKHWASGADIPEMAMEEWISIDGKVAHIHYKVSYRGENNYPTRHQELPAVYLDNTLSNLVFYSGSAPWTTGDLVKKVPGSKNEYEKIPENWAAWVEERDWGVGVFVPGVDQMTCFYVRGNGGPAGNGCSYLAPIRTMAIGKGFIFDYDVYLTIGTVAEIRNTFYQLHASRERAKNLSARP